MTAIIGKWDLGDQTEFLSAQDRDAIAATVRGIPVPLLRRQALLPQSRETGETIDWGSTEKARIIGRSSGSPESQTGERWKTSRISLREERNFVGAILKGS